MEANVQNKLISVIMAICLLCSMYYLARTAVIYTMQQEKRGEQPVIVLDAGHGGEDPGKIGINGALEKMSICRSPCVLQDCCSRTVIMSF